MYVYVYDIFYPCPRLELELELELEFELEFELKLELEIQLKIPTRESTRNTGLLLHSLTVYASNVCSES